MMEEKEIEVCSVCKRALCAMRVAPCSDVVHETIMVKVCIFDVFLTTKELAARWRMSPGSVMNMRAKKVGPPYFKKGKNGKVLYKLPVLIEYEREHSICVS